MKEQSDGEYDCGLKENCFPSSPPFLPPSLPTCSKACPALISSLLFRRERTATSLVATAAEEI